MHLDIQDGEGKQDGENLTERDSTIGPIPGNARQHGAYAATLEVDSIDDKSIMGAAWQIAAIQHEIFLRVFPGVRHEIISPISVSRMGITVLKRSLQKSDLSTDSILEHIAKIDEQMQKGVEGIRDLKVWDTDANAVAADTDIILLGNKLMAYRLSMRKIALEYQDDKQAKLEVKHQAFLYCWLAVLCYFEDALDKAATLLITRSSPRALSIRLTIDGDTHASPVVFATNTRRINQAVVVALLKHHAMSVQFLPDALSFQW